MTFATRPNLGVLGAVGLALQTALGTFLAPTMFLKATGGSDVQPDYVWARENFKDGNLFENASTQAGITYQGKSLTAHANASGLLLVSSAMFGAPAVGGVITPLAARNWGEKAPGNPFSAELQVPNGSVKVTDGQFISLKVSSNGRAAPFNAEFGFHAVKAETLAEGALTPVVYPTDTAFTFRDVTVTHNGNPATAESAEITIAVAIDPLDSLNGSDFIDGFERGEAGTQCTGTFTLQTVDAALKAAYTGHTRAPVVFSLKRGGKEFTVTIPSAELESYTIPAGMGRIQPVVNFRAVSMAGEAPFTIKATNT
ncbi:phage tail tube protein [Deinococcus altitudinis]|uniref:phage tail tube protein n=1 Tax=Deinococcus altitudinis TaxID=468914 RepID=UPI00389267DD